MSVGTNTGIQNPYGLGDYSISTSSTEILRKFLLGKNLQSSYLAESNPIPPSFGIHEPGKKETTINFTNVKNQKTVSEQSEGTQESLFLDNMYGPEGGYSDVQTINVNKLFGDSRVEYVALNSLQPKTFTSANYTPSEILETVNITNGLISTLNSKILSDSHLIEMSAGYLRRNLGYNQKQELYDNSDKGGAKFNISTSPGKDVIKGTDYLSRLANLYYGDSNIPGDYLNPTFIPDINGLMGNRISYTSELGNIQATANAIVNMFTPGGNDIPSNSASIPVPSDKFIEYMGKDQQSSLFDSLKYNVYRPDYSRARTQKGVNKVESFYYVGSKESEPGKIQSPMDAVPRDEFGRTTGALVYGPSSLAKELETVDGTALWGHYFFGLQGATYVGGGSLAGGWTWYGKTSFASLESPTNMLQTRSNQKPKRKGGILDQTQQLIDSAPMMGGARRKHVGNAIDQTSKIFNDGYKDIPKGSGARLVENEDPEWYEMGLASGNEYCRTWTKDNPYYKFKNLQKSGGLLRGSEDSVLDDLLNLSIAPIMQVNGKNGNVTKDGVKKYMFSIENLAWRGSDKQTSLPAAEKGPNGGRIMWFPPYELSIGDTNSAQWNSINFLGRPEPIYTYNYTERIGTLGFKIVVDHPSILNVIAQKELKNKPDFVADRILDSFFAGCKKYDIWELAERFGNFSLDDINDLANLVGVDIADAQGSTGPVQPTNESITPTPKVGDLNSCTNYFYGNSLKSCTEAQIWEWADAKKAAEDAEGSIPQADEDIESESVPQADVSSDPDNPNPDTAAINANTTDKPAEWSLKADKILAKLLGEQNYFKYLEENDEFVYNSLKSKLKYFHPSFHSTTPEGLNSRLTFLLQCTRPGNTIQTKTEDGLKDVDAENTAFGTPPICVLRIGDFYHTKIVVDSVSFSYDPLVFDLNPEGIGVQPMIATVSMNFKYIGGQGLEAPVSELQNALSNNYFANTELYEPTATTNEEAKKLTGTAAEEFIAENVTLITAGAMDMDGNPIGEFTE